MTQLRQERDQLRAQLQQFQNVPVQQAQSQPQPQIPQVKAPPIEWTKQNIEKFNQVVDALALKMSGLTKDDIAGLEFRDDGDELQERWKYSREQAKNDILNNIRQAQERYVAEQTAFLQRHQASMQAYNEFAQREMAEQDYQQVFNYAANDYFKQQTPMNQQIINDAFIRIQKGVASPADTYIMSNYYTQAKASYRGGGKQTNKTAAKPKVRQPPNLPKVDGMSGTTNPTGDSISINELEKLIEAGDFKHIPKKYQDYYRNSTAIFNV